MAISSSVKATILDPFEALHERAMNFSTQSHLISKDCKSLVASRQLFASSSPLPSRSFREVNMKSIASFKKKQ